MLMLERDYIYGPNGMVVQLSPGENLFAATDHLGHTRVLFERGFVHEILDFAPFGEQFVGPAMPGTTHLFTGHERDLGTSTSELDYMHQRYYSPGLARFVSVDPVQGQVGSSQSWNRYSYVQNNPVKFVDPTGEATLDPNSTEDEIRWIGDAEDEVVVTANDPVDDIDPDLLRIAGGEATVEEVPWNPEPALEFSVSSPSVFVPDFLAGKGVPLVFDVTASVNTKGLEAGLSVSPGYSLGLQASALFTGTVALQPPSGGATTSIDVRGGDMLGGGLGVNFDSGGVTNIKGMVGYGVGGRIKMNHSTTFPILTVKREW